MKLPQLKNAKVSGKTIFLRADLDVPLTKSKIAIEDDTRLLSAVPTIEYLLKNNAKVIIGGHLGRPKAKNYESRIMNQELSLRPIAKWLAKRFKIYDLSFMKLNGFEGWEIDPNIFLLENLRFYAGEEQDPSTSSGQAFAKKFASLADIYVNDAFAVCHRNHASIAGVPKYLPHFAGLRLQKEIEVLGPILKNPKRPLIVIIGGAKIETKLSLVERMHHWDDYVLVGGKIAKEERVLLKVQHEKIRGRKSVLLVADLNKEETDITSKSLENFLQIVGLAKTVVWNGPVGRIDGKWKTENGRWSGEDTERGTMELARGIVRSGAYTVVGGGDTIEFLKSIGVLSKFSFVSTGGGAMLAFLSGEKLPGLEALIEH